MLALAPLEAAALYSNDDDVTVLTRMSKCTFAAACPVLFSTHSAKQGLRKKGEEIGDKHDKFGEQGDFSKALQS